jgi:hypothetical protein
MIPVISRNQEHPYSRWRYEGLITLTNPPTVDDFQVQVTIPYQLGMNSDFSDLRFADVYGNALPYWIQSKTDNSTATVFVKLPSMEKSICFFYGNELAASESDGYGVFDFFDDFDDNNISDWASTGTWSVSGGIATSNTSGTGLLRKTYANSNCVAECRMKTNTAATQYAFMCLRKDALLGDSGSNVAIGLGGNGAHYSMWKGNGWVTSGSATSITTNTWYHVKAVLNGANVNVYYDGNLQLLTTSASKTSDSYLALMTLYNYSQSFDWFLIRKYLATEPTALISYIGTNRHYRRVIIHDNGTSGGADTISISSSMVLTLGTPSLFLTTDALLLQSNVQLGAVVGISDRIPLTSALILDSSFDRIRSFGDISALASESVDISKGINDTTWVLRTSIRGDSPAEFFHYTYETQDHIGTDQVLFTGFTPDTVNAFSAIQNRSDVVMYDYGWYLSAQYLPDDALVINLSGSRTTWAEWIRYLLEGTGITAHRIASSSADDKEFNFTAKTTRRDAIDAISKYCGFVFVVGWGTGTPADPIAYWIDQNTIDDASNGLDLPAAVTITWPDSHLEEIPSVQGTPEEKINRVRIRGNDTAGNWYSATQQTTALTAGEEIAREYYEESSAWNSQAKVNARALALYNYFTATTYTVEAKFLKRMDLRLYQKIRFTGSGFSSKLTALGWLRIIEIHYYISGIEKYVTIKAVTDKGQLSLLLERMNYAAGGAISDINTIVSNQISAIPMTEVGTVLSVSGDIATVQTESGKIVQARIIS